MGHRASSLVKEKGVRLLVNRCFGKAELFFPHSHTQTNTTPAPNHASSSWLSSCRLTMCIPTNYPFLKPFSIVKKAITRSRSPIRHSTDITGNDLVRPSCNPPIMVTPSSTIRAADIAMPATSKIIFNVPGPKWTLIAHWIKFAGDQVVVPQEGMVERSQEVLPISTGLH